jgi:fimbrial chaperone protein
MFRRLLIWSFVALAGFGAVPAHSSRVTPMVVEMTPGGRGSLARIEVANTDGRDIPMEIRMYRGRIAENGELELEPADDRFAAFPPQVVIPPNGRQVFRIQFIPNGPMTESEIYYASISQLPVELEETGSRIQMLMRFNVLVNVVPEGTTARPEVESVRWVDRELPVAAEAPEGTAPVREQGLEVRIVNRGNRYFPAGRIGWEVTGTDQSGARVSETFPANIVSERIGMGIVAPGRARVFFMPMERQLRDPGVTFKR